MKKRIEKFKKTFHIQSFVVGVVGVALLAGMLIFGGPTLSGAVGLSSIAGVGTESVAEIMKDLVQNNLTRKGTDVEIEDVAFRKDLGLYEVLMKVGETKTTAYLSKDGKHFAKEVMSLDDIRDKRVAQEVAAAKEAERKQNIKVPTAEKPVVEAFIMSHCPYGTQVQKGLLPVIDALGKKADIRFKYVDYLMHGKKELDENLNQYCVEEVENKKYLPYLECFLGSTGDASDSARCMKEVGISEKKIASCVKKTDVDLGLSDAFASSTKKFPEFDLHKEGNEKYKVGGSPTVVVNGTTIEPNRDPNSLLKAICKGFENAPAECEEELSKKAPAPGFGVGTAASASGDADCEE